MEMPSMPSNERIKSFWKRPEGKFAMILGGALGLGVVINLGTIMAFLAALAANTFMFTLSLAGIAVILLPLASKSFRRNITLGFELVMREITNWIVRTKPLDVARIQLRRMRERADKFEVCLKELAQSRQRLFDKVKKAEAQAKNEMIMAEQAKKQNRMANEIVVKTRQAGRLKDMAITYVDLYKRVEKLYAVLRKVYDNLLLYIQDKDNEISVAEEKWKTIKSAYNAMQSAISVYNGNKDERALFDDAMEFVANDISNKSGEIEHMLSMSEGFMNNIDLQNGVMQEQGLEMLSEWEKKADNWLLDTGSQETLSNPIKVEDVVADKARPNDFSNLFRS